MTLAMPTFRRLRIPTLDARVVGGVVLVAISIVGGLRLTRAPEPATRVYVASTDLDAGHVLSRDDLQVGEVRASDGVLGGLARWRRGGPPTGLPLRVPVHKGAAVSVDALGTAVAAGREITIPVTPDHALGGEVRAGDRIDLFATFDKGTDAARTMTVARSATVHGVVRSDGLFGQHAGAVTALTLDVKPDVAVAVAFAARNAELDVVRARGVLNDRARDRYDAGDLK